MDRHQFLNHIGGLRGLAIMLVVLFHLNGAVWPQGYLGVDVFLVISGYLLFRNRLKQESPLSLVDTLRFAWRRIQRIIAPMCIVILLTVGVGLLFMLREGELLTCRLGEAACLGRANSLLTREMSNYFAPHAGYTPLLHLWYLSVTLQVYLIYAVGNYALQRLPKCAWLAILSLVGLASMALHYSYPLHEGLAAWGGPVWEQAGGVSYYATLPRLWEILAGGAVILLPQIGRRLCTLAAVGGAAAILICALGAGIPECKGLQELPATLITVVSTMLIIRYLPESHLPHLLSNKPLLLLGQISFSIYLVHMPIIVFWRMWEYGNPSTSVQLLTVAVSIAAGWLFWWCVEKRRPAWWLIILLWVGTYITCRSGRRADGFRRFILYADAAIELPAYPDWQMSQDSALLHNWSDRISKPVYLGDFLQFIDSKAIPPQAMAPLLAAGEAQQPADTVLIGDSHALHTYAGFDHVMRADKRSAIYAAAFIYPFHDCTIDIMGEAMHYDPEKETAVVNWLRAQPQLTHVVIAQRWIHKFRIAQEKNWDFETALRQFVQQLHALGKRVILLGPTPEFPNISPVFTKIAVLRGDKVPNPSPCSREQYLAIHKEVLPILQRLEKEGLCTLIVPLAALPEGQAFKPMDGGVMLMADDNHLSTEGSVRLMDALRDQWRKALAPQPTE